MDNYLSPALIEKTNKNIQKKRIEDLLFLYALTYYIYFTSLDYKHLLSFIAFLDPKSQLPSLRRYH